MRRVGNAPVGAIIYANSFVWKFISLEYGMARCRLLSGDYGQPIGYETNFYYANDISKWPWSKGSLHRTIKLCSPV